MFQTKQAFQKENVTKAYDKYATMLYQLALSHLQKREDAEDVVQEVFIKFVTKAPAFADEAHKKAWFIRVTINQCKDHLRYRRLRTHIPLHEIGELSDSTGITDEAAISVMQLLSTLPDKYKTIIVLHYLENLSVEEIASTLTLGKSAVKMRLARGREMLKKELEKEDGYV